MTRPEDAAFFLQNGRGGCCRRPLVSVSRFFSLDEQSAARNLNKSFAQAGVSARAKSSGRSCLTDAVLPEFSLSDRENGSIISEPPQIKKRLGTVFPMKNIVRAASRADNPVAEMIGYRRRAASPRSLSSPALQSLLSRIRFIRRRRFAYKAEKTALPLH